VSAGPRSSTAPPPLVSVVVPVFNGARFVGECLASLLAQEYPAVEVVVVDDGSADDSAGIAEGFAGVRVLRRPHEGLGRTRNAGIRATRGSLIGFCDADDTWKPEKARVQADYLAAHPECAVVLCRQDTIIEPGVERPSWLVPDQIRGDLDGISPTSGLFRREVLDRLGGFRTDMEMGADFNLLVRTRTAGFQVGLIERPLRVRRIHDDNMTTRHGAAKAAMFETVREHLRSRS
jgi:glycosyltransferase involved in cell wall biosynthesis